LQLFRNGVPCHPAFYKVGFQLDAARFGLSRERYVQAMRAEGVAMDEGFRALQAGRSPSRFRRAGTLHESERAHIGSVVLHHPVLLEPEWAVHEVIHASHKIYVNAGRLAGL
jgi:perosamine synthetase